MSKAVNIMIVDDSVFVRKILKNYFKDDPAIKIIAEAENGLEALKKVQVEKPDLVITDYEMPEMNGHEFLKQLNKLNTMPDKPPVLVLSSITTKGSKATIECLLAGAKDYIPKPSQNMTESMSNQALKDLIKDKVIKITENRRATTLVQPTEGAKSAPKPIKLINPGLVVLGCSTGGPAALEKVLKPLPKNFKYPILVVQHLPEGFIDTLVESLNKKVDIEVVGVTQSTPVVPGKVYIACGGKHMEMTATGFLDVVDKPPVNFTIPSVDVLFESVSKYYKKSVISVMLTGMGTDGWKGVKALKDQLDCFSVIQDQQSSVVWSMPRAVYEAKLSDQVLPVDQIGEYLKSV